jgi:dTDP-4-dehydrorhamnose 3,5-epimerase
LIYVVDNYYRGDDEFGVAWNDSDLGLRWGVESPILSPRDAANPRLRDIPPEKLPK